jgi:hypothetical protein
LALLALSAGDGRLLSLKRFSISRISAAVIFDARLPLFTLSPIGGILPILPPSFFLTGALAAAGLLALATAGLLALAIAGLAVPPLA